MSINGLYETPVLLAYANKSSARPGEKIQFMVSCEGANEYRADIVRLGCCDTGKETPPFRESIVGTQIDGVYPARAQAIDIGSYVSVPDPKRLTSLESFTMLVYVWPTRLGHGRQALMGTWREQSSSGYALEINSRGQLSLRIGDGSRVETIHLNTPLVERRWQLVGGIFDAENQSASLFCQPQPDNQFPVLGETKALFSLNIWSASPTEGFCMAAWPVHTDARHMCHFDGKLDSPRLLCEACNTDNLDTLASKVYQTSQTSSLVAAWDFSADIDSETIIDLSNNELHGHTKNLPMRAATGVNWSATEFDWRHAREEYGGIHFHCDDLYDAKWKADFCLKIPTSMSSGIYAARLRAHDTEYYVPFYVRPPLGKSPEKLLFLVPTATYMAYANIKIRIVSPHTDILTGRMTVVDPLDLVMLQHPELGLSTYDAHLDGSPVHYSSRLRPVVNCRPKESDLGMAYNNFACDLLLIDWLEHLGVPYDIMTDEDLHHEGQAGLAGYRTVMTGTHPEYHSLQMLNGLDGFVRAGGKLMYMGGNGFYWRVAFSAKSSGVIEHRRAQQNIARWNPGSGQSFHSFTGEHGGIWWDLGRPPQFLAGVGFIAQGFDQGSPYFRKDISNDPRGAFILEGIDDEIIGDFGLMPGGVAGIEIDRYSSRRGSPSDALVIAASRDHSPLYETLDEVAPDNIDPETGEDAVRADMVYFETANGGAVFSVGSIAFALGLAHNDYTNNVSRISENVLRRFIS